MLGALIGLIATVLAAIGAVLQWPIRALLGKLDDEDEEEDETTSDDSSQLPENADDPKKAGDLDGAVDDLENDDVDVFVESSDTTPTDPEHDSTSAES